MADEAGISVAPASGGGRAEAPASRDRRTAKAEIMKAETLKWKSANLDRAWTHSLPARSGCALLRCKILLTRSQLARIKGEL
jgi:hypothetical protein